MKPKNISQITTARWLRAALHCGTRTRATNLTLMNILTNDKKLKLFYPQETASFDMIKQRVNRISARQTLVQVTKQNRNNTNQSVIRSPQIKFESQNLHVNDKFYSF